MRIIYLLLMSALLAGCGKEIGDDCSTNLDCSTNGDRICDTKQTDGYCTIEGCDRGTCPSEATCVRFFPFRFLSIQCNPLTEDSLDSSAAPTNDCNSSEICLSNGFCVPQNAERRFCMKTCESDNDCRNGYECRLTGQLGSEAFRDLSTAQLIQSRFCAPKELQSDQ